MERVKRAETEDLELYTPFFNRLVDLDVSSDRARQEESHPVASYPFEATPAELESNLDELVGAVFATPESEFLVMPRGVCS